MNEPATSHQALQEMLDGIVKQASNSLRNYGYEGDWENVSTCWNEFCAINMRGKNNPKPVQWAWIVIKRAMAVRGSLNNNVSATILAINMANFIQAAERAKFSYFVPDIERGQKIINSSKQGHEVVYGTPEEKQARWRKYQTDLEQAHMDHPTWGIMALRETVAELNGVNPKTIQSHTSKTW
ncbi:MAG: hypothetical protein GXP14_05795 [Gammaproteobacteria bacterium]|nr:hypothetical protein [Gammaproteobacteria bacterium]